MIPIITVNATGSVAVILEVEHYQPAKFICDTGIVRGERKAHGGHHTHAHSCVTLRVARRT